MMARSPWTSRQLPSIGDRGLLAVSRLWIALLERIIREALLGIAEQPGIVLILKLVVFSG
jgi:hypothetical protein